MKIKIRNRFTNSVMHAVNATSTRDALEQLCRRSANLRSAHLGGADLRGAHLGGADLGGAHLGGADLRSIKHDLWGVLLWDRASRSKRA